MIGAVRRQRMRRFCGVGLVAVLGMAWVISTTSGLAAAESAVQNITIDCVKISYFVEGEGEPVLLIHGLYSSADLNWRRPGLVAALAKHHRVIALDLPGHGRSDRPQNEAAYGKQIVVDIIGLLGHLKIKQAHLVGYSLGGMVAVKLLATHPDRVLSAVIGGMGWLRAGSPLQHFWEQMPEREASRHAQHLRSEHWPIGGDAGRPQANPSAGRNRRRQPRLREAIICEPAAACPARLASGGNPRCGPRQLHHEV